MGEVGTIYAVFSTIDGNVGNMQTNGKTYLAFDELMLYIGTTKKELQKYKIERVNCIE